MNLLILGGTVFLGRTIVECARDRGHAVTLFNRGKSAPQLFPDAKQLHGDRDGHLDALVGQRFDACIDTCGFVPRIVRQSAQFLSSLVDRYVFVSSLSAYADLSPKGTDEDGALGTLDDSATEIVTGETYGPLKAACEREVADAFDERAVLVRPGLIVGPYDPSDRFTYWPWRVDRGGQILSPGRPERGIQLIDVRDLAGWILDLLEAGVAGAYNAVSTPDAITMSALLHACREAASNEGQLIWVSDDFLVRADVTAWTELPLWIPEKDPAARGFFRFRNDRAVAAGLRFRPLEETVRDTVAWVRTRSPDHAWRGGLANEKEREILKAWLRKA